MITARSLRTFLGSKNYQRSISFYERMGFDIRPVGPKMSVVRVSKTLFFYLQDYYVKDWCENSMIFLEVEDLEMHWKEIQSKNLPSEFPEVRVSQIQHADWGSEYFIHDPSGILWHIGIFKE
ncbi:glyoxalase [Algoriphagus sediminis]|uniref:Glyoxalase n=1 Tax=Algoriphagus sediminis TaxID=3057113 RepID=A0ABT7YBV0_9BACT|nr:glyoxalase [Algoriphagus sediminis]MDN3203993.1 glyoxalase [Algoriphagus sediminis]